MARVDLPQSKVRAKRRKRRYVAASISFVVLLLVLGGLVWLSHAPFLRISTVTVSGVQTVPQSDITTFVQGQLAGSYLYLFPKNNIFLYPKTHIEEALPATMPTVASAEVHAVNFHTLEVTIIERQPKALWCGTDTTASSSSCLLLDQSGAAYGAANNGFLITGEQDNGYKRYYGALTGSSTPQQYLTPDSFTALGALIDAIVQSQPQDAIAGVYVDVNSDVHVTFASGFELLFALSADGGDVYSRLQLALQSDVFAGRTIADFKYLDLRFGDRLYYKLK